MESAIVGKSDRNYLFVFVNISDYDWFSYALYHLVWMPV